MKFDNRIARMRGMEIPLIPAPMGWIARSTLASAVSRAGGLGIIETSSGETANCQREITAMVASGLPFGVNLPIAYVQDPSIADMLVDEGIPFVTTSAGSP